MPLKKQLSRWGLGPRGDNEQVGLVLSHDGAKRMGEALCARQRGLVIVLVIDADCPDALFDRLSPQAGGSECERARDPAIQELLSRMRQLHAAGRGPIARPERDHISAQLSCECRKTLGGRRIDDHVLPDAGAVEQAGADCEQVLGLSLSRRLLLWVGLGGVTHIGERDLEPAAANNRPRASASRSLRVPS